MVDILITFALGLGFSLIGGKLILPFLIKLKCAQTVRNDGPQSHLAKQGTPTMGGLIIAVGALIAFVIMARSLMSAWVFTGIALTLTFGFGLLGFLDDYIKVVKRRSLGLKASQKLLGQVGLAIIVASWAYYNPNIGSALIVPWANIIIDLGWFYIPFTAFVIVAMVNAVNLTDGLDGLAGSVSFINAITFAQFFAFLAAAASAAGAILLSAELNNMMIFSAAVAGGSCGFLFYNRFPAKVFMGDTGSMGLGGALVAMAVVSRGQLLIPILGITFVASTVSVILQVGSYKLRRGKRIFKMAPLHHHFELCGYKETTIVAMYCVVTLAMSCFVMADFFL